MEDNKEQIYQKALQEASLTELELPSKGKLYPKDNILSKGVVNVLEMTGKHENILLSQKFRKNNTQYEELLRQLIVEKYVGFKPEDLVIEDKLYLIIAIRIINLGQYINVKSFMCPHCYQHSENQQVDLGELKDNERKVQPDTDNINEFTTTLPKSGDKVTLGILTSGDELELQKIMEKIGGSNDTDGISYLFAILIKKINGDVQSLGTKKEYYDDLPIRDTKHIQKFLSDCTGNNSLRVDWKCPKCNEISERTLQFTEEFFFPEI